jgi:uncharacterized metal-binding protein YceD (DUF177 family)
VTDKALPWHVAVAVAEIPEQGLHREVEAGETERTAIAALAGLRDLPRLAASFDLSRAVGGNIHVRGRIQAQVGQTCVVSLEPLTSEVDEEIEAMFSPDAPPVPEATSGDEDGPAEDPPEPIVNGAIDLGTLATEFLMLGLDPYPRKEGAVFEPVITPDDPADHPFAALKALKGTDSQASPSKSGSKTKGK